MSTLRTRGRKWQRIRARILSRDPLCVECQQRGVVRASEEVDHIIPLHKGGDDSDENLVGICCEHHRAKTARDAGYTLRPAIGVDGWPL